MSKHLGNILQPMPLMDEHGADAVRWFMAASGSPWAARRVGDATLQEIVRKVLLTYWNTVSFHVLYANTAGWVPHTVPVADVSERPVLDRWALSGAHSLVRNVTAAMEEYDTQRAGALLASYIDDLSNWYVRRSRRRFWDGDTAAFATLHECLHVVTLLMAPLTPFISERVWQDVFRAASDEVAPSVHLSAWPRVDGSLVDNELSAAMATARRLVELGRSARAEAKVRTRQPLRRALVPSIAFGALGADLRAEVAAELNVEALESFASAGDLVDSAAKANFRNLGKRFGPRTPQVAAAIAAADPARLAAELAEDGTTTVDCDGPVELSRDDVVITERPREGWSVVNEHGETVALDLTLTPELARAGVAREAVRLIQEARKASGFDVVDRIRLTWSAEGSTAEALRQHRDLVAAEVLAVQVTEATSSESHWQTSPDLGLSFLLAKA